MSERESSLLSVSFKFLTYQKKQRSILQSSYIIATRDTDLMPHPALGGTFWSEVIVYIQIYCVQKNTSENVVNLLLFKIPILKDFAIGNSENYR